MKQTCDNCKRPVVVTRTPGGTPVILDPAPVLIYWLDRADCGPLAQRADDVKYYAPHRCDAPVGSIPARRVKAEPPPPKPLVAKKEPIPLNGKQQVYSAARLNGMSRFDAMKLAGYKVVSATRANISGWQLDRRLGIGLDKNGAPVRND